MGVGILPEIQSSCEDYEGHSVTHGNEHSGLVYEMRAESTGPKVRLRLLHFENTFGVVHASEYCQDAMLSLVLLMVRNARPDADRLARLTGTASVPYPTENSFSPDSAAGREAIAGGVRY